MRDPARIDQILELIRQVWIRNPDYRLTQLIINAVQPRDPCSELYQVEDTVLARKLKKFADWPPDTGSSDG